MESGAGQAQRGGLACHGAVGLRRGGQRTQQVGQWGLAGTEGLVDQAGVVVLFVQIGALSPETQYPCGFPAGATLAR